MTISVRTAGRISNLGSDSVLSAIKAGALRAGKPARGGWRIDPSLLRDYMIKMGLSGIGALARFDREVADLLEKLNRPKVVKFQD